MVLNPDNLQSSYRKNNYGEVFEAIGFIHRPKLTVEVGVLEGYSAAHLQKYSDRLILCDLFEDCPFKHAHREDIEAKFPNAEILKMDFYEGADESVSMPPIDLLHIDIANTGDTYRRYLTHYHHYVRSGGIVILEGGSEERDNHWWMKAFNKPKIQPALEEFREAGIQFHVIEAFPSLTIVRK